MGRRIVSRWRRRLLASFILTLALTATAGVVGRNGWGPSGGSAAVHKDAAAVPRTDREDELAVVNPPPPAAANDTRAVSADVYAWQARRDEKRVKIRGFVPSEEDRKTILGMIKANMPELEIDDRMQVAAGAPPKLTWLGAVSFALVQLSQLRVGEARLNGVALSVQGEARTAAGYAAVKNAVATQLPRGLEMKQASLSPPVAKPFTWSAQFENGTLTLTGKFPNDPARETVLGRASELFPGLRIVDQMELAAGAPAAWSEVVNLSLAQLVRFDAGKVNLQDTALTIEGVVQDEATAIAVANSLKEALPQGFEWKDNIRPRPEPPAEAPKLQPQRGPAKSLANPPRTYPA